MTCDHFRELMTADRGLADLTRAERWAAARHYEGCAACREYLEAACAAEEARHGPIPAAQLRRIDREHARLERRDAGDPEL